LVEIKANSVRNLASKDLTDNEISEMEFEKIICEAMKWNEKYKKTKNSI